MSRMPLPDTQMDLFAWAEKLKDECDQRERANAERASRRGYLVFATDPSVHPDDAGYREVYATEAKTSAQAVRKVRALAEGRRLHAYLATGTYRHELANARWLP